MEKKYFMFLLRRNINVVLLSDLIDNFQEALAGRCSVKKVFLKISQNSLENTCSRVSFLTGSGILL